MYPPAPLPTDLDDDTPSGADLGAPNFHAKDLHAAVNQAVNDIVAVLGDSPQGVHASVTERLTNVVAYQHVQVIPAAVWTVQHNLGYKPGGWLIHGLDGSDHEPASITHVSNSVSLLTFYAPLAGTSECS